MSIYLFDFGIVVMELFECHVHVMLNDMRRNEWHTLSSGKEQCSNHQSWCLQVIKITQSAWNATLDGKNCHFQNETCLFYA